MIKLKDSSILMLIPRFLRNNKKIKNLIIAIETVLKEVLERFAYMKRMQKISEGDLTDEEIELLMWEKHVDYFDKTLTREQKIELIQNAERGHLQKGTPYILKKHLNIIFGELELQEWFEVDLEPFHFHILTKYKMTDETLKRINRTVEEFKTTRSLYEGVCIVEEITIPYKKIITIEELSEESFEVMLESEFIKDYQKICLTDLSIETL